MLFFLNFFFIYLQLYLILFYRKLIFIFKSFLFYRDFYNNLIVEIYRKMIYKYFLFLLQDFEIY